MQKSITLPTTAQASIQLLQITDTHLFADQQATLLGINTWQSYQSVLQAIEAQQRHCDLLVVTGDLVQDHNASAYWHFASGIKKITAPCVWLPGNHDFQPAMYHTLQAAGISPAKHVIAGAHWQILLLDSQVTGVAYGELSDYQLDWLTSVLSSTRQRHTLLLLHHHPIASGCAWLDQHSLRNAAALADLLADFPLVKHLLCGHIHQEMDTHWHGRRLLATPSTCVQFKPGSAGFALDTLAPGWRWLELHADGSISTQVYRLAEGVFVPDITSGGY